VCGEGWEQRIEQDKESGKKRLAMYRPKKAGRKDFQGCHKHLGSLPEWEEVSIS
jgi:hypothetical protein